MSRANASPTKQFFVSMITRDISLEACVLDLLDNAIDGARRMSGNRARLNGYQAFISFDQGHFEIVDNCGGISIENAEHYAFHFGKRPDDPQNDPYSIGLYGIGMKRAVFKMGTDVIITSSTRDEAFDVILDVNSWLHQKKELIEVEDEQQRIVVVDDWDFPLEPRKPWKEPGTNVRVETLHEGIAAEFADEVFENGLIDTIQRDYSFFLQNGFEVSVNGAVVEPYPYRLRMGTSVQPARVSYNDGNVNVTLIAGLGALPQDDIEPEADFPFPPALSGWFVICNDRVVLPADKTERTSWGVGRLPMWHAQYNGFVGLAFFQAQDAALLPWDTTKRNIEVASPVYRRALGRMREMTRPYTTYTNRRKDVLDDAKDRERQSEPADVSAIPLREQMMLPELPTVTRERMSSISYKKPKAAVDAVKEAIGRAGLTNADVGSITFDYYNQKFVED